MEFQYVIYTLRLKKVKNLYMYIRRFWEVLEIFMIYLLENNFDYRIWDTNF